MVGQDEQALPGGQWRLSRVIRCRGRFWLNRHSSILVKIRLCRGKHRSSKVNCSPGELRSLDRHRVQGYFPTWYLDPPQTSYKLCPHHVVSACASSCQQSAAIRPCRLKSLPFKSIFMLFGSLFRDGIILVWRECIFHLRELIWKWLVQRGSIKHWRALGENRVNCIRNWGLKTRLDF